MTLCALAGSTALVASFVHLHRPPLGRAIFYNGVLAFVDGFNTRVPLVWVGIGTAEPAAMHDGVKGFHEALEKAGIKYVFYESPGTAHEWQTWRRSLHEFFPLLSNAMPAS